MVLGLISALTSKRKCPIKNYDHSVMFIHTADLHLDSPFQGLTSRLGDEFGTIARGASLRVMQSVFDLAIEREVDFIVIAGDLYDGAKLGVRAKVAFLEAVRKASRFAIRVFVSLGNHDPVGEVWLPARECPSNLHIFSDVEPETVSFVSRKNTPIEVTGISYGRRHETDNLAKRFPPANPAVYSVGVLHANVGSNGEHALYAPASLEDLTRLGYDYFALGHIHTYSVLNESPLVVYSGTSQGRSFKPSEHGPKGAVFVDSAKTSPPTFVELAQVRFEEVGVQVGDVASESELAITIATSLKARAAQLQTLSTVVFRVILLGLSNLFDSTSIDLAGVNDAVADIFSSQFEPPRVFIESIRDSTDRFYDVVSLAQGGDFVAEVASRALTSDLGSISGAESPLEILKQVEKLRMAGVPSDITKLIYEAQSSGLLSQSDLAGIEVEAYQDVFRGLLS